MNKLLQISRFNNANRFGTVNRNIKSVERVEGIPSLLVLFEETVRS